LDGIDVPALSSEADPLLEPVARDADLTADPLGRHPRRPSVTKNW
jgi:hypothetical protein